MKKPISVSNLTLDLYLDYVRPAAIAAEAEQQPTETENAPQAATQAAEEAETTTPRRHYWILRGNMDNSYALRWTDDANGDSAAQALQMERITRARAMDLARRERERRRYDPGFSGYADAHIHPLETITIDGILHDISAATSAPGTSIIAERA